VFELKESCFDGVDNRTVRFQQDIYSNREKEMPDESDRRVAKESRHAVPIIITTTVLTALQVLDECGK
jgi:hypothetical protein